MHDTFAFVSVKKNAHDSCEFALFRVLFVGYRWGDTVSVPLSNQL